MSRKLRVGVLLGGRSAEHEVSLRSAKNVVMALNQDKYEITLLGIDKQGEWFWYPLSILSDMSNDPKTVSLPSARPDQAVALIPGKTTGQLLRLTQPPQPLMLDVIFPVLHGTFAEDGTLQGLLEQARIPYVGADVLGSSMGMDKDVAKRLLRDAGIPVARFITVMRSQKDAVPFAQVVDTLGLPCFVKPANAGSSVGVHKVSDAAGFEKALQDAFLYDTKVLIEEAIVGRELECSVLGNERPEVSIFGEVIPQAEFYSYEAKYIDPNGAILAIPARLTEEQQREGQKLALRTYQTLCLEGMSRVDFFLRKSDGTFLVNEVNTFPGFTQISMYPKLWEASGLSYSKLLDRLIALALERFDRKNALKTDFFTT